MDELQPWEGGEGLGGALCYRKRGAQGSHTHLCTSAPHPPPWRPPLPSSFLLAEPEEPSGLAALLPGPWVRPRELKINLKQRIAGVLEQDRDEGWGEDAEP